MIASGARYRRLDVLNLREFEGRGVWYWASPIEARLCRREEIVLVGGGNSAGQAGTFAASPCALTAPGTASATVQAQLPNPAVCSSWPALKKPTARESQKN